MIFRFCGGPVDRSELVVESGEIVPKVIRMEKHWTGVVADLDEKRYGTVVGQLTTRQKSVYEHISTTVRAGVGSEPVPVLLYRWRAQT